MSSPVVVYCDFDGTITHDDVVDVLLDKLADPSWRDIEAQWEQGLIGSRECLARQIPLIRGGWEAIAASLQHVTLEPTFPAFAAWCRANAIPMRIISDGLDRVIHTLLARHRIVVDAVWANHLEESPTGQLSICFPYPSTDSRCDAGLCKCQGVNRTAPSSLSVVVGDGRSDWCWATHADWLFAKSSLLTYCRERQMRCQPFEDFKTIQGALESFLDRVTPSYLAAARSTPSRDLAHVHQPSGRVVSASR